MSGSIVQAVVSLRAVLAGFEVGEYEPAECYRLADELARTEKACAAARLLAAARAVSARIPEQQGHRDGASWMARGSGITPGQARQALDVAGRLGRCPETKEALQSGQISLAQAAEITKAEDEAPGAESELLAVARSSDLSEVRSQARDLVQRGAGAEELHRRQFAARQFRSWRDRLGMVCFSGALPPELGVPITKRIELLALRLRREARIRADGTERFEAYSADAFASLFAGTAQAGTGPPAAEGRSQPGPTTSSARPRFQVDLVIVCDIMAWRRGYTVEGEVCHIVGGGPIPVSVARDWSDDAFVKAVLHDGVEIHNIRHFGRHIPAVLRTALDLGPVPGFSGRRCVDCGCLWHLENDHINPVANHGPTEYANLQPRCYPCHQKKTERDRQAGRLGRRAKARAGPPGMSEPADDDHLRLGLFPP